MMEATHGKRYHIGNLWTRTGWLSPGFLETDETGTIAMIAAEKPDAWTADTVTALPGFVVPGMINLHSHAHQRGLAGRGEGVGAVGDAGSFWGWRRLMYRFVNLLSPDDLEAIAAQAYLEMLEAGFTTVGEFHYFHHDRDGAPYADTAELSNRIIAAAEQAGIGLTLLPSLYAQGSIGEPPSEDQQRFVHRLDPFLGLVDRLLSKEATHSRLRIGIAPHSLRAVTSSELIELVETVRRWRPQAPIHIHAAEQAGEVELCVARIGARPVQWLVDNVPLDDRWTIIHATHTETAERADLAHRGVVVGLCPMTEANLGDGIFSLAEFHRAAGRWGIGTDSNIAISVGGELRLLEYGQRLVHQRRDVLTTPGDATTAQPGRLLYDRAAAAGAQSLAHPVGAIAVGARADLVELDPAAAPLVAHSRDTVLDGWLFGSGTGAVRTVIVGDQCVVRDGCHINRDTIQRRFRERMQAVWATGAGVGGA